MTVDPDSHTLRLPDGSPLTVSIESGVFKPTLTTELMIRAASETQTGSGRVLDLGAGCGVVGLATSRMGLARPPVCASDVSGRAIALTLRNARELGIDVDARIGPLLDPWAGEHFDLIIDDVSGVAEDIARFSPWFAGGVPHETGPHGADLTLDVLRRAPAHLVAGGVLLFPVISLSATEMIIETARALYRDVREVTKRQWELPKQMAAHIDQLRDAKRAGRVQFEEKFGMVLCYTSVFRCTDPMTA